MRLRQHSDRHSERPQCRCFQLHTKQPFLTWLLCLHNTTPVSLAAARTPSCSSISVEMHHSEGPCRQLRGPLQAYQLLMERVGVDMPAPVPCSDPKNRNVFIVMDHAVPVHRAVTTACGGVFPEVSVCGRCRTTTRGETACGEVQLFGRGLQLCKWLGIVKNCTTPLHLQSTYGTSDGILEA